MRVLIQGAKRPDLEFDGSVGRSRLGGQPNRNRPSAIDIISCSEICESECVPDLIDLHTYSAALHYICACRVCGRLTFPLLDLGKFIKSAFSSPLAVMVPDDSVKGYHLGVDVGVSSSFNRVTSPKSVPNQAAAHNRVPLPMSV